MKEIQVEGFVLEPVESDDFGGAFGVDIGVLQEELYERFHGRKLRRSEKFAEVCEHYTGQKLIVALFFCGVNAGVRS